MPHAWKRFIQNLLSQPNRRRTGAPAFQPAAVESLEERTVLSAVALNVVSDTYITTGGYDTQDDSLNRLRLYDGGGTEDRILLQTDLSSLFATGSEITNAVLTLNHVAESGAFGDSTTMTVSVFALATAWTETATWDQTGVGGFWKTPGGDFADVYLGTLELKSFDGPVALNVTAAVKAWQGGLANYGLAIVIETSTSDYIRHYFASSESSNGPQLVVDVVDSAIPPRSPVATFVLSHLQGDANGADVGGQLVREIAHKMHDLEHNNGQHPTSNPGNAHSSNGHASDHNPTLGAVLPSGLGKLKRAID